jgi:hypothetical protein
MSPMGLRSEKDCTGDARQKLKSTDQTSRQRGRPTSTNPQLSKNNKREKGKNWPPVDCRLCWRRVRIYSPLPCES